MTQLYQGEDILSKDNHLPFQPNTTQIPNVFFDYWMGVLTHAQFKVLMAISRKTFGWHKRRDAISRKQIAELTGLHKDSVRKCINELEKHGLLIKTEQPNQDGDHDPNLYEINVLTDKKPGVGVSNAQGVGVSDAQGGRLTPPTTYTIQKQLYKKQICPKGVNAPCLDEKDECGHTQNKGVVLRGKAKEKYESLSFEQKQAFTLIMNVPPIFAKDEYFNAITALNLASTLTIDRIRKGILVYKQRLERGEKPKKMAAYLHKIFKEGYEPTPLHFEGNKQIWEKEKKRFPEGSYVEDRLGIIFPRLDKEVTYSMSPQVFLNQLKRIHQSYFRHEQ